MNRDHIAKLLDKYWKCETTVAEEQELRRCFARADMEEEFQRYASLFTYVEEEQSVKLSRDFDLRLQEALRRAARPVWTRRPSFIAPLMRIAASILLIGGMGVSLFFISRQRNQPRYAVETDEASHAMEQATYALKKLSYALQMSEEASMQTIQLIDEMEIDWALVDSLSSETPQMEETDSQAVETEMPADANQRKAEKVPFRKPAKREDSI